MCISRISRSMLNSFPSGLVISGSYCAVRLGLCRAWVINHQVMKKVCFHILYSSWSHMLPLCHKSCFLVRGAGELGGPWCWMTWEDPGGGYLFWGILDSKYSTIHFCGFCYPSLLMNSSTSLHLLIFFLWFECHFMPYSVWTKSHICIKTHWLFLSFSWFW